VSVSARTTSIQYAARDIRGLDPDLNVLITAGSLLVIATTIFGFKAIDKLALLAVPLRDFHGLGQLLQLSAGIGFAGAISGS
jgi:purine-cytosine permease-like protein